MKNNKNRKKKIIQLVVLISVLCIVIFIVIIKNKSNPAISRFEASKNIQSIKKIVQRNDQSQLVKEKSDESQKERIDSVPVGSNITFLELKNIIRAQFDEIELELNDKYECPDQLKDKTKELPFEVSSTHCEKLTTQHGLDVHISNSFNQNSYMQFLISIKDQITKKSYTLFNISFDEGGIFSMGLNMINSNVDCFRFTLTIMHFGN
jgi:hypothetical protein